MEINTAEMFYKALVIAVFDYGSVIFFPRQESKRKELERTQYQGLRTALDYRMSTPTNVVLEEAKIVNLRERTIYLAKNLLAKMMVWGKEELNNKVREIEHEEMMEVRKYSKRQVSAMSEVWRRVRKDRGKIRRNNGFDIYKEDYWEMTKRIEVEVEVGMKRKRKD